MYGSGDILIYGDVHAVVWDKGWGNGSIIEAYVGEYANGKSENVVNRAIYFAEKGLPVTLVDLDTVEP